MTEGGMLADLMRKSRSYRRFHEEVEVSPETLTGLVELARLAPTVANCQPLRFLLSRAKKTNELIFAHLSWARNLPHWPGPSPGERPAAYVIILGDREVTTTFGCMHGIAAQSIMLGAVERGLGGCIMGSIEREGLRRVFDIPPRYDILLAVALGKPREVVVIDDVGPDGDTGYWRDTDSTHHVPKRSLADLVFRRYD